MSSLVSAAPEVPVQDWHDALLRSILMFSFSFNGFIFNFYCTYIKLYIIYRV